MKKTIFILLLIVVIVIIFSVYFIYKEENKSFYKEIYSNYSDVDDGVDALINSKKFKIMNENEQIKIMEQFLELYESSGTIKNLKYESNSKLYSFTYSNGELKGSLGGVQLKKFDPTLN